MRRRAWVARAMAERSLNRDATFLTLTFNDSHLPSDRRCRRQDIQRFVKRLRNVGRDFGISIGDIKYFGCGEYGSLKGRPHYHLIVYGVNMLDDAWQPRHVLTDGRVIVCSGVVEKLWPYGYNSVDRVTMANIGYVSKYVCEADALLMYSQGLGRGLFVDVRRKGRRVIMEPKPLLRSCAYNDSYVSHVGGEPRPLPRFVLQYVRRFYPLLYRAIKEARKRRFEFLDSSSMDADTLEMLYQSQSAQTRKRRSYDERH